MVTVCPATVSVPLRDGPPALAAAAYVALPFPLPVAPAVIDSHGAFAAAVHAQSVAPAVTTTFPEPPVGPTVPDVGVAARLHATPACVTVTVCPATVSVPIRCALLAFAGAAYVTAPLPAPEAPAV